MIRGILSAIALALIVIGTTGASRAQTDDASAPSDREGILGLLPASSTTEHTITKAGRSLDYRATAATLPLRKADGEVTASMFYVAYTVRPTVRTRPLTFVFNGGPGAASLFLHLGALGPKGVVFNKDGSSPPPPARLADNPDTWLAFTDLVFVDPIGTGFSRAADPNKEDEFWGVQRDEAAMAAFIRLYLERNTRATSPIFLVGESYGGLRAALLAQSLPEDNGIGLSGIVLVSPALELFLVFGHEPGQILPSALALPSMAAVDLYKQGVVDRDALATRLDDVIDYALTDYLAALAAGPETAREQASAKVAAMVGLPVDTVREQFGRVPISVFLKSYDRARGRRLSSYDGTISGPDPKPSSPFPHGPDPVLDRITPILTSAFVDYVGGVLGYKTDISYRLLDHEISGRWDYGNRRGQQGYAGAMDDLQSARVLNPALQVLIASGYTDLVTPFLASHYLVMQMPPLAGAAPIVLKNYLGGHMMYLRPDSRHALADDVRALYRRAQTAIAP